LLAVCPAVPAVAVRLLAAAVQLAVLAIRLTQAHHKVITEETEAFLALLLVRVEAAELLLLVRLELAAHRATAATALLIRLSEPPRTTREAAAAVVEERLERRGVTGAAALALQVLRLEPMVLPILAVAVVAGALAATVVLGVQA
jgi:hypothetical protein